MSWLQSNALDFQKSLIFFSLIFTMKKISRKNFFLGKLFFSNYFSS